MRAQRIAAIAGLLMSLPLLTTPTAAASPNFAISRSEIITTIKTIGVMPVEMDEVVPNQDEVAATLEQDIAERLQRGGFTVVSATEMRAIRARGLARLGGLYDPMTGLPNREKVEALQEFSTQEYRRQHPVDALLRSGIVRRQADFNGIWYEWDGVREQVTHDRAAIGVGLVKTVPALSLTVSLDDAHGKTVYSGEGGLLVLAYPIGWAFASLVEYDFGAVGPKSPPFGDPAITARALTVALDPLATGAVSKKRLEFELFQTAKDSGTLPVAAADLLRDHQRLVLASLEIPGATLEQGERVRARYRELLAARFTALGFELVGGNDFDRLWAAERAAVGGFYDPLTGRPDLTKLSTSTARVLATLRQRYDLAGVIMPSIAPRKALSSQGYARWDGATEPVSGRGSAFFNRSIFNRSLGYAGYLDANSLELQILDGAGQVLYKGLGGVQLTRHLDHGSFLLVPDSSLFADATRDAGAVDAALRGLAQLANRHTYAGPSMH